MPRRHNCSIFNRTDWKRKPTQNPLGGGLETIQAQHDSMNGFGRDALSCVWHFLEAKQLALHFQRVTSEAVISYHQWITRSKKLWIWGGKRSRRRCHGGVFATIWKHRLRRNRWSSRWCLAGVMLASCCGVPVVLLALIKNWYEKKREALPLG